VQPLPSFFTRSCKSQELFSIPYSTEQSHEYTRESKVIPTDFAVLVAIELEEHNIEVLL